MLLYAIRAWVYIRVYMLWGTGLCYGVRVYDMGYGFMIWGMDLNGMGYGLIY